MRGCSRRDFLRQTTVTLAMAALASRAARADALTNSPYTAAFIDVSGDELILGGRPLSWWIETFGLPFHVSYAPDIKANLLAYKDVFERLYPRGEVRYAGKASTHPAVFRLAAEAGVGIDVASPYETRCALEAGVPPEKLDVNGNSKDDDLINLAVSKNMLIIADSIAELERIAELAKNHQETPRVVLRVIGFPLDKVTSPSIFTAGEWSKFGIFISDIPPLLSRLGGMPVKLLGFHTHIGSQITDLAAYQLVLGKLIELGTALRTAGQKFEVVNMAEAFRFLTWRRQSGTRFCAASATVFSPPRPVTRARYTSGATHLAASPWGLMACRPRRGRTSSLLPPTPRRSCSRRFSQVTSR
jgi:diaminopimelate decarboxylase